MCAKKLSKVSSISVSTVFILTAVLLIGSVPIASATILYFDNITTVTDNPVAVPNGYGGLNWDNFYAVHEDFRPGSGYDLGCVSPHYVAFNGASKTAMLYGDVFNFEGAYFTAAWNASMSIYIEAYRNGSLVYDDTISAVNTGPTWYTLNYVGIDEIYFDSSTGGQQFAIDNFTYTPEPATVLLLAFGGLALRKRK